MTRKLWQANGSGLAVLKQRIETDFAACTGHQCQQLVAVTLPYLQQLSELLPKLAKALKSHDQPTLLANAQCFMNVFSSIVVSWIWIRQANAAEAKLQHGKDADKAFYMGKIQAAKYYVNWELPLIQRDIGLLNNMDASCAKMQAEWF